MFITFVRWRLSVGIKRITYLLTYLQTKNRPQFHIFAQYYAQCIERIRDIMTMRITNLLFTYLVT